MEKIISSNNIFLRNMLSKILIKKRLFLAITFFLCTHSFAESQCNIIINEIMQSNIDLVMEDYNFPDSWAELYNTSSNTVSLRGMAIGLNSDISNAFYFNVDTVIPPHGHLVVFCDKEGHGLHADFRMESGKGNLFLFASDGSVSDYVHHPKMPSPGIAYGRKSDGSDEWQYELCPTPGSSNQSDNSGFLLPDPIFSMEGCLLTSPVTVEITMPNGNYPKDTRIYYTLDGSEPSASSTQAERLELQINKTTVIRAKLMSATACSPRSLTQSYIFLEHDSGLPVFSLATDSSYLFGGMGICSSDSADGLKPNYEQDWRRPINIEYFGGNNREQLINQLGETALGGRYSRRFSQKSLKLYANKRFGKKRFKASFWKEKPEVTEVKSMMLRNGGNMCNWSRIDDAFGQRLFGSHVDSLDYQAYTPVICYINGIYKGVYGLRERGNDDFIEANYGLDDSEIDESTSMISAEEPYKSFRDLYRKDGVTYEELDQAMNMPVFINWLITESFAQNNDWPWNNIYIWRAQEDGKWSWVLKDLDRFGNVYDTDFLNYLFQENVETLSTQVNTHKLMQVLRNHPQFCHAFIDHFAVYLGDFLKPEISRRLLEQMWSEIEDEIVPTHIAWQSDATLDYKHFKSRLEYIWNDLGKRPSNFYRQLSAFFNLGTVIPVKVTQVDSGSVNMNNIRLTEGNFDGAWFSYYPLNLNSGNEQLTWNMEVEYADGESLTYHFRQPCISLKLDESLVVKDFVRGHKGDIFSFLIKARELTFREVFSYVKYELGIENFNYAPRVEPFGGLFSKCKKKTTQEYKTYPDENGCIKL